MLMIDQNEFNKNMEGYMKLATAGHEVIIVHGNEKNVVIISEDMYNNLLENAYIMGEKANIDWLMESRRQLKAGESQKHELTEDCRKLN